MSNIISFIVGLIFGNIGGVALMCMLFISRDQSEREERELNGD